ncbi:tetratricopeptide repeat protein [Cyanobium sp. LEGE 06143]|uniref:tetratricopeptide repeat protein n=1 Tax=Cyanobium sp. LEGE 06143 TaxID=945727 RepID=UPI001881363B|nr:tetratricopeptide repeat protein [Cyanobium sp. LEGE 06143]MBE9172251.1 tetratricopeptide repeat protein [Cyanobium sp. LEGE 06143]
MRFTEIPSGRRCSYTYHQGSYTDLIEINDIDKPQGIRVEGRGLSADLAIQPSLCSFFANRRVAFAMTQDNDLRWITDWAEFYVHEHGADGILVYDHQTTLYETDAIDSALRIALPKGVQVAVIRWPFPYGVFDIREGVGQGIFDSCYCQCTIFEHARWRLLQNCSSAVNADIDELLLCKDMKSVFQLTEQSDTGYLRFAGNWVTPFRQEKAETRPRHHQYLVLDENTKPTTESKWSVVPSRCPKTAQWMTHVISVMSPDVRSGMVWLRHFMGITTNWSADKMLAKDIRTDSMGSVPLGYKDTELEAAFGRLRIRLRQHKSIDTRPNQMKSNMWRIEAGKELALGHLSEAETCINQALEIEPAHPNFLRLKLEVLTAAAAGSSSIESLHDELNSVLTMDAAHHCQLAINHLARLEFHDAENLLQKAIELDPKLFEVYESYAKLLELQHRENERWDVLQQLEGQMSNHLDDVVWLYRSSKLLESHYSFWEAALCAISQACTLESDPMLRLAQACLCLKIRGFEACEALLLELLEQPKGGRSLRFSKNCLQPAVFTYDNGPATIANIIGYQYVKEMKYSEANSIWCRSLKRWGLGYLPLLGLHTVQQRKGRIEASERLLKRAAEIASISPGVYFQLSTRQSAPLDHYTSREVENRVAKAVDSHKNNHSLLETRIIQRLEDPNTLAKEKLCDIKWLISKGSLRQAEVAIEQHRTAFTHGHSLYLLSQLHAARGEFEQALRCVNEAMSLLGQEAYLMRLCVETNEFRDDQQAILVSRNELVQHRTAYPRDYLLLAKLHRNSSRLYTAKALILEGVRRFSQSSELASFCIEIDQQLEIVEGAAAVLRSEASLSQAQPLRDVVNAARKVCSTAIDEHRALIDIVIVHGNLPNPIRDFFSGWLDLLDEQNEDAFGKLINAYYEGKPTALNCYLLGLAALKTGKEGYGVAYLREAIKLNSNHLAWRFPLSKALAASGDLLGATDQLLFLLRQRQNHAGAQGLWRKLYSRPIGEEELAGEDSAS